MNKTNKLNWIELQPSGRAVKDWVGSEDDEDEEVRAQYRANVFYCVVKDSSDEVVEVKKKSKSKKGDNKTGGLKGLCKLMAKFLQEPREGMCTIMSVHGIIAASSG